MSEHTPGPWEAQKDGTEFGYAIMAGTFPRIAYVHTGTSDARLIAAAPALAAFVEKRMNEGDDEAKALWEQINARS